jgi:hypothetical protein
MRLARGERRLDRSGLCADRCKCVYSEDCGERQGAHAHSRTLQPFTAGKDDIINGREMFATVFVGRQKLGYGVHSDSPYCAPRDMRGKERQAQR